MDAQATFSCSFTQCDLGPLPGLPNLPIWAAQKLLPTERQDLAVQVLAGAQPIAELARQHEVSRKFLYRFEVEEGWSRFRLRPLRPPAEHPSG